MPFHPTGESCRVTVSAQTPKTVEIVGLPQDGKVLRLVALTYPGKATCFVSLGTAGSSVTSANGMPLDLANGAERFVSVADETHLSVMMDNSANYSIAVTPGEIV